MLFPRATSRCLSYKVNTSSEGSLNFVPDRIGCPRDCIVVVIKIGSGHVEVTYPAHPAAALSEMQRAHAADPVGTERCRL